MKILNYPDPLLKKISTEVTEIGEAANLVIRLDETLDQTNGIGLAAPQIGINRRVFIMNYHGGEKVRPDSSTKRLVVINPRVLDKSDEVQAIEEGCLSLPGINYSVKRPRVIDVEFQGLDGESNRMQLTGMEATCFQHELDHLDGVVFIDRIGALRSLAIRKYMKEQRR